MLYNWIQNITFAHLWVLPFLGLVPIIAWLYFRKQRALKSSFTVSTTKTFKVTTARNFFMYFPFWFRMLALVTLITALARPQIINSSTVARGEGIDIVLCIDVSGSMLSQDFAPNRLEVAKSVAADFIGQRPIDQISLVIFSGESFTLSPLTGHHEVLLEQVRSLKSGMLQDGTLIGEGLATSVERLSASKSRSKVVILLTDGKEEPPETRIIDPLTALEIAKAKGVRVYTIGMAALPGTRRMNAVTTSPLDDVLLHRIATETGGLYFRASDRERLQDVYAQIDRMEKSSFERVTSVKVEEQYFYFLLAALFFLLLEVLFKYTLLRTFP